MRIIALLFAFVLAGCTGNRLNADTKPIAVALCAPPMAAAFMGIRDKPTAPASPWQNGFAERLIGSIRRECLDHVIVLGEVHLRRILKSYVRYYNDIRTHRSLDKDAPVTRQIQR